MNRQIDAIARDRRHEKLPDGTVMVDGDPYIVYDGRMQSFAKKLFDEADELGFTSKEDKARYLTGRLFEMSPFGVYKGSM